jgi:hypothetical protein
VQQLLSKAISKPFCGYKDAAHQEKRLLLLLTEQEPEARQLLQQHLFPEEKAKLGGKDLNSSNFPGSAFCWIMLQKSITSMTTEVQPAPSTPSDSSSTDSSLIIIINPCKPYLSASATAPHPQGRQKAD